MVLLRKLSLALMYAVFLVLLIEAASFGGYYLVFGKMFTWSGIEQLMQTSARRRSPEKNKLDMEGGVAGKDTGSRKVHSIHPYYGYVWRSDFVPKGLKIHGAERVNDFGFLDPHNPIQKPSPKRLIVGITGGSVAFYCSAYGVGSLAAQLLKVPEFKGKELVVLRLALGAWKQPQQLLAVGELLARGARLDILINIDGYNEMCLPAANLTKSVSPFFPYQWYFKARSVFPREVLELLGMAKVLTREKSEVARKMLSWHLYDSVTAGFLWCLWDTSQGLRISKVIKRIQEMEQKRRRRPTGREGKLKVHEGVSLGPPEAFKSDREMWIALATHWARSSALLEDLITSQGGRYYHFLQPNQYFVGSKPISPGEAHKALRPGSPNNKCVGKGYPYLRAAGTVLAASGVSFHDMTMVFAGVEAPLYVDDCCHFNNAGIEILMGKVGKIIARSIKQGKEQKPVGALNTLELERAMDPANLAPFKPLSEPLGGGVLTR